jgi:hypothetical protein
LAFLTYETAAGFFYIPRFGTITSSSNSICLD